MRIVLLTIALVSVAAAQYASPQPVTAVLPAKCVVGELMNPCPGSCNEPKCGDDTYEFCALLISCPAPKCTCDRANGYARDPTTDKCVLRKDCPSWTTNPCMTVKCSAGYECRVTNGKAGCVKTGDPVELNACAATTCMVGSICVEENGQGRCVEQGGGPSNCTGSYEEWRQCATCDATCDNRNPFCNKMCQPARCMCRQGFFRDTNGRCVTANDCDSAAVTSSPSKCNANEEYRECATACEPSCKNVDRPQMCIAMCRPPACQCKQGFYRSDSGECVSRAQCKKQPTTASPQTCKRNERFASCSSMCEPQCGQYEAMACIMMCGPPKCQCAQGFYRNANGECMTRAECDKKSSTTRSPNQPTCGRNQIWSECSSPCASKCGDYEIRPCMAMCGPPKCECDRGFYLDKKGECVTRAECDAQAGTPSTPGQSDCKPNELFTECSTMCEEKCNEKLTRACPAVCGPAKCQCQTGFFRNRVGDCVDQNDCDNEQEITCANIDCMSGMICEMQNGEPKCVVRGKLTCNTVKCAGGNRCEIQPDGSPKCIPDKPSITCANVRCAGPCTDTPTGPVCGPRPTGTP